MDWQLTFRFGGLAPTPTGDGGNGEAVDARGESGGAQAGLLEDNDAIIAGSSACSRGAPAGHPFRRDNGEPRRHGAIAIVTMPAGLYRIR